MSTRITKTLSAQIAEKLTADKKQKCADLENQYYNTAREIYMSQLPKEVVAFFEQFPEFSNKTSYLYLDGYGFREGFNLKKMVPTKRGGTAELNMSNEVSSTLNKLKRAWQKSKGEYGQLLRELEAAIFSSTTYAKLEEHFPEAAKFLPEIAKYSPPAINYDKLREKLKQVA